MDADLRLCMDQIATAEAAANELRERLEEYEQHVKRVTQPLIALLEAGAVDDRLAEIDDRLGVSFRVPDFAYDPELTREFAGAFFAAASRAGYLTKWEQARAAERTTLRFVRSSDSDPSQLTMIVTKGPTSKGVDK